MHRKQRDYLPLDQHGPLRVLFAVTSLPVGGAETLLLNLVRRLDRRRFQAEICCLKEPGPLGLMLAGEFPLHAGLLQHKFDLRVLPRLATLLRARRIDALVTVGAGDKMFWGRLAARWQAVPVVLSAIHSSGWPDSLGRLNRLLTRWTDGFIAVAPSHGRYLVRQEGLPADKVTVIPNGVDAARFRRQPAAGRALRRQLAIPAGAPVVGIVAALRPEKNLPLFLRAARIVADRLPGTHFLVVGDGPERPRLEQLRRQAGLDRQLHLLGCRHDIPELLSAMDLFALTSHNEANPVSILEAMACALPVVSTNVGSVFELVTPGHTGWLTEPGAAEAAAGSWMALLCDRPAARQMGRQARQEVVGKWSLGRMVEGYESLIAELYRRKQRAQRTRRGSPLPLAEATR